MKKFIALLLALVLALSMTATLGAKSAKLTLTSPTQSDICTVSNEVVVKGCAPVGSTVTIKLNDESEGDIVIGKTGVFVLVAEFKEGKNTLEIIAVDAKGNKTTITSTHNFELKDIKLEKKAEVEVEEEEVGFMGRVVNAIKSMFSGD